MKREIACFSPQRITAREYRGIMKTENTDQRDAWQEYQSDESQGGGDGR